MDYGEKGVFYFETTECDEKAQLFKYGGYNDVGDRWNSLNDREQLKLRQLTLISLCETRARINYEEIANALGISLDQVEIFVLEAILDRAIDGHLIASEKSVWIRDTAIRNAPSDLSQIRV